MANRKVKQRPRPTKPPANYFVVVPPRHTESVVAIALDIERKQCPVCNEWRTLGRWRGHIISRHPVELTESLPRYVTKLSNSEKRLLKEKLRQLKVQAAEKKYLSMTLPTAAKWMISAGRYGSNRRH
jgi:hypothetical protein